MWFGLQKVGIRRSLFFFMAVHFFEVCDCNLLVAQGVMERLRQFDVESVSFDVPHIVHFDVSVFQEMPMMQGFRSVRFLGRTIRTSESQLRTEYLFEELAPRVGFRERGLYLQHSSTEKIIADFKSVEDPHDFYSQSFDKLSVQDSFMFHEANPYSMFFNGSIAIGTSPESQRPLQRLLKECGPLDGDENYLVHSTRPMVAKFEFDDRETWKILKLTSLHPAGGPRARREYKKKISSVDDCKGFVISTTAEAKWMELGDGTNIPFWIHHRREDLSRDVPGGPTEMEAFFFGVQIEPKIDEKLFDPSRVTKKEWIEDFNVEQIEALAKSERERLLVQEKRTRSKRKQ